jgi:hypothetical protein
MTITRLFLGSTFVAGTLWWSVLSAHPLPEDTSPTTAVAGQPGSPAPKAWSPSAHGHPSQSDARHMPSTKKPATKAATRQAAESDSYRLSHQPRQLDSYQKAVTPQVATDH